MDDAFFGRPLVLRRDRRGPRAAFGATALLLAIGCGELEQSSVASVEQTIRHGQIEEELSSIVGLFTIRGGEASHCTGTLIAPNLVLTARHCVADSPERVDCRTASFGDIDRPRDLFVTTETIITQRARFYAVSAIEVPTQQRALCGHDIALLRLEETIPASIAAPIAPRLDDPVRRGELYMAVGYGHVGDFTGMGVRRSIRDRAIDCGGSTPCERGRAHADEFVTLEGNACQGDSGGAALDDQGRVLGVLSRISDDPRDASNACYRSVHTALVAHAAWLRAGAVAAARYGAYEEPSWVQGDLAPIKPDPALPPDEPEDCSHPLDAPQRSDCTRGGAPLAPDREEMEVARGRRDRAGCSSASGAPPWRAPLLLMGLGLFGLRLRRSQMDFVRLD